GHTRFSRDWSSDVCSSDLGIFIGWLMVLKEGFMARDEARSAARVVHALASVMWIFTGFHYASQGWDYFVSRGDVLTAITFVPLSALYLLFAWMVWPRR